MVAPGGACMPGGNAWQRGVCMAKQGVCGKGGAHAWQRGGMCGEGGACVVKGGCVW